MLWEGTVSGGAHRYGKRNEENLNEVLSDALKEAYANGVSDPSLVVAMSGGGSGARGGGAAPSPPARAEGIAPARLLSELVDLKKQGFTTDLLVQYVNQKTLSAEMSGKDMAEWKQAGMPPAVIKAALARGIRTSTGSWQVRSWLPSNVGLIALERGIETLHEQLDVSRDSAGQAVALACLALPGPHFNIR